MAENRANFVIGGLSSEEDAQNVRQQLEDVDGVMSIELSSETGEAAVHYDYDILSEEKIKATVRDAGYEVE